MQVGRKGKQRLKHRPAPHRQITVGRFEVAGIPGVGDVAGEAGEGHHEADFALRVGGNDAAELFSNLKTPIINMYRHIITTLLALATLTAHAQKTVIEGTVLDAQGKSVDAYVTVAPKGTGNILGFADTDTKGHYRLEFTTQADSVTVTVCCRKVRISVDKDRFYLC